MALVYKKEDFPKLLREIYKFKLLEDINLFILKFCGSEENNVIYDIDIADKKFEINNIRLAIEIVKELQEEIQKMGWNCFLCFGDTGLCIYDKKIPAQVSGQLQS